MKVPLKKKDFPEEFDLAQFDPEHEQVDGFDLGGQEIELEKSFSDLKDDIDLDLDEFQGRAVISVGDDEVIDLGDESDLERDDVDTMIALPDTDDVLESREDEPERMEEEGIQSVREEGDTSSDVVLDLHEEEDEEELEEDFMQSLGDIDIDLEEDVESELEAFAADEISSDGITSVEDVDGADVSQEEEFESTDLESEFSAETPAEEEERLQRQNEIESEEDLPEPEIDVREFLGLTLRLDDEQVQEFETMIDEAETLQKYLEELDEHKEEIKENIFHKLHVEYIARKTVIFKSSEFETLLTDVEQDLEYMLKKQSEFVATLDRMNEELEEIEVRHLVGEYDDGTLTEKEQTQRADIAVWNAKAEKIADIIARYQKAIDAERALNPLRQEEEQEEFFAQETPSIEESDAEIPSEMELPDGLVAVEDAEGIEDEEIEPSPISEEEDSEDVSEAVETAEFEAEDVPEEEFTEEDVAFEENEPDSQTGMLLEETPVQIEGEDEEDVAGGELYSFGEDISAFDSDLSLGGDFEEGEFELEDLSGLDDEDEELAVSYEIEALAEEEPEEDVEQEAVAEDMINCKKCGRSTPIDQKFCVHCGGKAQ